jgi:hypothetical protein
MAAPAVVLADGDGASGMAMMLADLLESNVRDFPSRRRVATLARGEVVFTAADRDLSVTLAFGPGSIEIRDGAQPGAPVIAAPWLAMTKVCSGTLSPWVAWRDKQLTVDNLFRAPLAAAASSWALSVPPSFYEQAGGAGSAVEPVPRSARRGARIPIVIGVGLGVVAVVVVVAGRKRRSSRAG